MNIVSTTILAVALIGVAAPMAEAKQPKAPQNRTAKSRSAARHDCLVIGDSLAVGLGMALKAQGIRCDVYARKGLTAWQIGLLAPIGRYSVAYVSAGSNNPKNPHLEDEVRVLRSHIRASKVVWILPYDRTAAQAVNSNAAETGGLVVDMAWFASRDRVHPVSYGPLARMIVR